MRSIKQIIILCLLPLLAAAENKQRFNSPSEKLQADIEVKGSHIAISLFSEENCLVQTKTLQFTTEKNLVEGDWLLTKQAQDSKDETWCPVYGERSQIRDCYNELNLSLSSSGNQKEMLLSVRLYDEGLAFRYSFDKLDFWNCVQTDEQTDFLFQQDCKTWVSGNAQGMYNETTLSKITDNVERPLVVEIASDQYVALGEAALVDYSRMKFRKSTNGFGVQSSLSGKVNLDLAGYTSPWRYVMVGKSPGELLENNFFILNLNESNQIENTSWIRPGKVLREVTLTTKGAYACIDYAAGHQIEYVEFDAGWYGLEYDKKSDASTITLDTMRSKGPFDLHKIIEYANQKQIGILLYVNMNALSKQLDQILPLYQKWGVKGVKYGFVDVGNQYSTSWLHHAVRKAAKYELMVDIHDEYRPTGYSRTYPNLITQEGIRGDEESPSVKQSLYTLFIRMIAGAGDYTNCFFADRVTSEKMGGKAAQMAKAVAIYSPWQFIYWYDRPEGSPRKALGAGSSESIISETKETDFYSHLPTVWDDTKVIDGSMGQFASVARRSGNDWYVGTLNADNRRTVSLPLDFLKEGVSYKATLYYQTAADKRKNTVSTKKIDVKKNQVLPLDLEADSGCAVYLTSFR